MSFQILLHWAGPKQAMKDSLVFQVPFTSQTYAFHNTRYGFCSAPEPCCPARSSSASLDSLEVPTKQQRRRRMPLEPCCPGIRGLPLGATVLPQLPGTTLREQPTSLPGRAALLSQHPPPPATKATHHSCALHCQGRKRPLWSRMDGSLPTMGTVPLGGGWICASLSIPTVL